MEWMYGRMMVYQRGREIIMTNGLNVDATFSEKGFTKLNQIIEQYQKNTISTAVVVEWATTCMRSILSQRAYSLNEMELYPLLCDLVDADGNYEEKIARIKRIISFEEDYYYAFTICFEKNNKPIDVIRILTAYLEGDILEKDKIQLLDTFVNNTPLHPTTLQELLLLHLQLFLQTSLFFEEDDVIFEIGNAIYPNKEDHEVESFKKRIKEFLLCYLGEKSIHVAIIFKNGIHWSVVL